MDFFDKYKFASDNPDEFRIDIKNFEKPEVLDESHLSNLLSHSIRITHDILPNVTKSIDVVFKRLKIENQFNLNKYLLKKFSKVPTPHRIVPLLLFENFIPQPLKETLFHFSKSSNNFFTFVTPLIWVLFYWNSVILILLFVDLFLKFVALQLVKLQSLCTLLNSTRQS